MGELEGGFPRRELWLEGIRAVRSRWVACTVIAISALLSAILVGVVGQTDVHQAEERLQDYARTGGFVLEVRGENLPISKCDGMRGLDGVRTAGAVLSTQEVRTIAQPGLPTYVMTVTPGYLQLMFPAEQFSQTTGVVVGQNLTAHLGLMAGSSLAWESDRTGRQTATVDAVAIASSRSADWNDAIVLVTMPAGTTSSCVVEFEPETFRHALGLIAFKFHDIKYSTRSAVDEPAGGVASMFSLGERPSRLLPAGLTLVLLILVLSAWWARRNEFAIYRLLGVSRFGIWRPLLVEAAVMLAAPIGVGAGVAATISLSEMTAPSLFAFLIDEALLLLAAVIAPLVGLGLVSRVRTIDAMVGR